MCRPEHCSRGKMEKETAALQPHSSKEDSESLSLFLPQPAAVFTGSFPLTLSVSTPDSYDHFSPSHQISGCLSPSTSSEQDDLTCLSWLHQTQNLLPLQPMSRNPILSRPLSPVQQLSSSPVKPPYSFSSLIFMAIEDSAEKRLPVKDIYRWIVNNFPYYREAQGGWRNSVRHNLSLSKSFQRLNRDMGHSIGKGSLWRVCPEYRPALLEVLRKTHCCHRTSDNLLKNISLLGADYNGQTTISETMDISDFDSLSSNPPCSLTPDHEELVHIDPRVELTEAIGEDAEKDPLADSGYIELHYYQYQQYQYLVVPGDTDLETVEILQLDAEAQEAAGSLLDLAGGNRKF